MKLLILINLCCLTLLQAIQPNILLIIVDDLRPALGCYGDKNAFTPNIDKLARSSFVFRNVFAQQALCAPSRNSFLTSRRPDSLHLYDFYSYWRDTVGNFTTLPQYYREHGYFTQSIGKVFHPGISSNFTDDSPYSWSTKPFHPKTEIYKNAKVCNDPDGSLNRNLLCPVIVDEQPEHTLPDLESTQAARDFLDNHRNQPYFLAVGYHKPHIPFKFPTEYLKYHPIENVSLPANRWRPSLLPTVAWNPWTDIRDRHDIKQLNISFPFGAMPDNVTKKIIQHYNAATSYVDDLIGKLLTNLDNNTIVVLTADHGWSRSEHGEFSKFSNFDISTRVPLLIHVPGLTHREVIIDDLVELVDLFPTLVDLTGLPTLEICTRNGSNSKLCTEGRSMLPIMLKHLNLDEMFDGYQGKRAIFTQYPRPGVYPTLKPNSDKPRLHNIKIMGYSIRTGRYRYTEWVEFNNTSFKPNWRNVYGSELYDHLIDRNENLNLASRPQLNYVIELLRKQLILGWRYA